MITVWAHCKCGNNDLNIFETEHGEFVKVKATCNRCGAIFFDIYKVEYVGRQYYTPKSIVKLPSGVEML